MENKYDCRLSLVCGMRPKRSPLILETDSGTLKNFGPLNMNSVISLRLGNLNFDSELKCFGYSDFDTFLQEEPGFHSLLLLIHLDNGDFMGPMPYRLGFVTNSL